MTDAEIKAKIDAERQELEKIHKRAIQDLEAEEELRAEFEKRKTKKVMDLMAEE